MDLRKTARIKYRNLRRQYEKSIGGYVSEYALYTRSLTGNQIPPEKKFVIYAYQRTGSTLLVDLLNSHPEINCKGELLLNKMHNPKRYLQIQAGMAESPIFGFKLLTPHFDYQKIRDPRAFMAGLYESNYQIILLQRQSTFRTALSLLYAIKSWRFHFQNPQAHIQLEKITINPDELVSKINWIEHSKKIQEDSVMHLPHLKLTYEGDLLDNERHQMAIDNICDYLQIPHAPVNSQFIKLTPDCISQLVTNMDEIVDYFRKSPYRDYLEDI